MPPAPRLFTEKGAAFSVAKLIEPELIRLGLLLVWVHRPRADHLQIMIEHESRPITVDDCEVASKALKSRIEEANVMGEAFSMEVSSPGIDRMLVRQRDFFDAMGYEVALVLKKKRDGVTTLRGKIEGLNQNALLLSLDVQVDDEASSNALIAFTDLAKAQLVMTSALLECDQTTADRSM